MKSITAEVAKQNVLNFNREPSPTKFDKQALNIIFDEIRENSLNGFSIAQMAVSKVNPDYLRKVLEELEFDCKISKGIMVDSFFITVHW